MEVEKSNAKLSGWIEAAAAEVGVPLAAAQIKQLATHFRLLLLWNEKINLTAIRRPDEIASRHFGESLFLTTLMTAPQGLIVDVGSGAGFPGLPLKIIWAEAPAVLMEPNQKKAMFLKEAARQCRLENVRVITERLEDAAGGPLEQQAELVTMRAVAADEAKLEVLRRLLKPAGRLALWVGADDAQRLSRSSLLHWHGATALPDAQKRLILLGQR